MEINTTIGGWQSNPSAPPQVVPYRTRLNFERFGITEVLIDDFVIGHVKDEEQPFGPHLWKTSDDRTGLYPSPGQAVAALVARALMDYREAKRVKP